MPRWIHRLFHNDAVDRRLDAELQFHIDQQIAANLDAGMTAEEARRWAQIEIGGLEQAKQRTRDVYWENCLENIVRDFRFAIRSLNKDRRFALAAIVTLALGISATTVMFSLVYHLVINPFPYKGADRERVINIHDATQPGQQGREVFSIPEFIDLRQQGHVFEDLVGAFNLRVIVKKIGEGAHDVEGVYVTTNVFDFYGMRPLLGRGFLPEDGEPGAPPAFVMNYNLWVSQFNSDPTILGKTILLNGEPRTLVGIMPPPFQVYGADVMLPLGLSPNAQGPGVPGNPGNAPLYLWTIGLLKPGVSDGKSAADLEVITQRLSKVYPKDYPQRFTVNTQRVVESFMGKFRIMLYALFGAVGMLLLIACSNVANLLLVRATVREKEVAIRASIGASRGALVRQFLVEMFVLATAACAVGCMCAYFGLKGLLVVIPEGPLPDTSAVGLDPTDLLFAVGIAFLTTFICGFIPALHAIRPNLRAQLTSAGTGANAGHRHGKLRSTLVIAEVAFSIALLLGAGLMMRSFFALTHVNLGFDPERILFADLATPTGRYDTAQQKKIFFGQLLNRVKALPGVIDAAEAILAPPFSGGGSTVTVRGKPHSEHWDTAFDLCSEGFFRTLGLELKQGRLLSENDVNSTRHVAVINQSLAGRYFGGENAIGQKIKVDALDQLPDAPHDTYFEIVGVVTDFQNGGLEHPTMPEVFLPYTISGAGPRTILARTEGDADLLLTAVQRAVWAVDSDVSVSMTGSLETFLQRQAYVEPRFDAIATGAFAGVALALALLGIFSAMAYTVSLQAHDIGIRLALGAQQSDILRMVLRKGLVLIAAGIVIGVAVSLGLTRFIASQLWGVSPTDPWTFVAVVVCILVVGLAACFFPARRATQVDPVVTLRYE